ncbi:hypothetical protein APHAL10511_007609 [Amanita phalloides]|nr:hypothetical protein APHAL10511_007609 [Amanita phalloides]
MAGSDSLFVLYKFVPRAPSLNKTPVPLELPTTMKFFSSVLVTFFALATLVCAQDVYIGYPPAGKRVHPGEHLPVEIAQPISIQGSWNVGVAIGISSCVPDNNPPCQPASNGVGYVLYAGSYKPELHSRPPRYQNFTVEIPTWYTKGPAQLNVAYAGLFGASAYPYFQAFNQTLVVV